MTIVWYLLCGFAAGVFGGMGMGGGTLLIPLLTLLLHVEQLSAQAVNLVAFIPMAIAALAVHFKNKLIDLKNLWLIVLPAIAAAVGGAFLAAAVDGDTLKKWFGGFLILLGVLQVVLVFVGERKRGDKKEK